VERYVAQLLSTLGIETSCDETAVAVIDGDGRVGVNLLASQVAAHAPHGGVVPELASREHLRTLPVLVERALEDAGAEPQLVAVTGGPGLVGALLVGLRFAAALAWAKSLPMVAVDHLEGHLASPFLSLDGRTARPSPDRVLALVASGGHSSWYLVDQGTALRLCRTRDDAAGETFDKVGQLLGLPYPGGPHLDRLARGGDPDAIPFPQPRLKDSRFDLSFSGLKSAAARWIRDQTLVGRAGESPGQAVADLAASFERAVVDHLLGPLDELIAIHRPELVTASGGVAANTLLRERLGRDSVSHDVDVLLPPPALTTDNGAMVARAGQLAHARGADHDPRRVDAWTRDVWQPPGMRRSSIEPESSVESRP
jgi:N6-L-threonylcarbamoyladenine synthase